jgi:hypothetical protein
MLQLYDIVMIYNVYMSNSNCTSSNNRAVVTATYLVITVTLIHPLHNKS